MSLWIIHISLSKAMVQFVQEKVNKIKRGYKAPFFVSDPGLTPIGPNLSLSQSI